MRFYETDTWGILAFIAFIYAVGIAIVSIIWELKSHD